jgi:PAS domain-containing protein
MRLKLDSTQSIARPSSRNPRIHLLADVWLLTIIAIVVATGVPWYTSGLEVDVGAATWGVLAIGGIQVALTILASPSPSDGSWRDRALTLLDVAGVIIMGFVWEHVGAFQNPMFLTIFALPVIGAIFLSRWHPFLIAAVSILVVAIAAVSEAPELRWYASGLFGDGAWMRGLLGREVTAPQPSFSGFYAPPSYLVALLEVFTIALIGCALAAEYVGTIFQRIDARSMLARDEAERGQELWTTLIERLPLPALLIDVDTMQVIAASKLAADYLQVEGLPLEGRSLFDVVRVSYPEIVNELISGAVSVAPVTVIRVADQLRLTQLRSTQLRALHLAHKGRRLTFLTIEDITEAFCLKAALDTSEYAAVVVDARGRVLAFNALLIGLFGGVEVGADVAQWLPQAGPDLRWWEAGLTGRRKMHIEIGSRIYLLTSSVIALAGEEERISSVTFLPVAKAGTTDPFESSTTRVTRTRRESR